MYKIIIFQLAICFLQATLPAHDQPREDDVFLSGAVPHLRIEIPPGGMRTLRGYHQVWGQPRPERVNVPVTVREGSHIYTNVAMHLKGSFTFEPLDARPSLTLNFDKLAPGQRFHGRSKVHLNNSVQDPSYLCEQLARELFTQVGVPSPRAAHVFVQINGRDLGLYVAIEGANKQFLKRHFKSTEGNLYDGGGGGEVTKQLKAGCGDHPDDRSDLARLVKAAREPELATRWAALEKVLDLDQFISFAATEAFIVHWDGYCFGCNNYQVFHDVSRDKMVFIPHGLDQLFGTSSSTSLSLTPQFKGMIARALFSIPEGRRRYLQRIEQLSTNEFRSEVLHAQVDKLAAPLRQALKDDRQMLAEVNQAVQHLKIRITQRAASVAQQLGRPARPLQFGPEQTVRLANWNFKSGVTQPAGGSRQSVDDREVLQVMGTAPNSSGSWRRTVLLEPGHYQFKAMARTERLEQNGVRSPAGVLLRISGERSIQGISINSNWTPLTYEFDVRGPEDVELVCEFRGQGSGWFDAASLRLLRKGPPSDQIEVNR